MEIKETIIFNGVEYRLLSGGRYYLSQSTTNDGRRHAKSLHVAIWEYYNKKPCPKGYEIHHIDGNCYNNDISNLECVSIKEHRGKHTTKGNKKQEEHLEKIRPLSKEWHSSEEGKEWHREHAKNSILNAPQKEHTCIVCGKKFTSRFYGSKFCSQNCRNKHQYQESVKYVTRTCVICGKEFQAKLTVRHPEGGETCSRSCRSKLAHKRKREAEAKE